MGIPDGQGARHITGNGGEKSKKKKRKKNPEIRKRRAKRKEKSSKEGYEGATKERKEREREREIEVRKRREFGNPIGFCCASDSPIIETAFYTWKQFHGGMTVQCIAYGVQSRISNIEYRADTPAKVYHRPPMVLSPPHPSHPTKLFGSITSQDSGACFTYIFYFFCRWPVVSE